MLQWLFKLVERLRRGYDAFSAYDVPTFATLQPHVSREQLKRTCRILFIDDEPVELIKDLQKEGFSVEYDPTGDDITKIERAYFDLIVLDYKGVGKKYGNDHGLSLLKAIKRVNPAAYVLAYTSQSLAPKLSAEFYTLVDGSLNKDEGVADSIERIEEALRASIAPDRLWRGVLASLALEPGSPKALALETRVMKAMQATKIDEARAALGETSASAGSTLVAALIEKLVTFAFKKASGI